MSAANPMSVSTQNSQSAWCSSRNSRTALLRASARPSVPHFIATYPPRMIRASWIMSHAIISIIEWCHE